MMTPTTALPRIIAGTPRAVCGRLSLGTPDQNDQGQGDGEEQNHSWHVTEVPV